MKLSSVLHLAAVAAVAELGVLGGLAASHADPTYPVNNPTYIPAGVSAQVAVTGPGDSVPFQVNGQGTLYFRVLGTNSGLAATVQVTEARTSPITWSSVAVDQVGGTRLGTISGNGLYRVNVTGVAQVRLDISALSSGTVLLSASADPGSQFTTTLPIVRQSYSAAATVATGATTHFLVVAGSATKTVRITGVECSGKATAALAVTVTGEVDSAVDTGDAGTAATVVPRDSANAAGSATVTTHTTSPTPGALVGNIRAGTLELVVAATPITAVTPLRWTFGSQPGEQEVVLRGVAQQFALNTSAAFGTAAAVGCSVDWTEE